MRAGKLNKNIVIEKLTTTKNEFGEEQSTIYCEKFRTRADVIADNGNREVDSGEVFYAYIKTFIVWDYIDDMIDEFDRIVYKGKPYRIITKDVDEQNKLLTIKTELMNE